MSIIIDGTGSISGVSSTGLSSAQTVASAQLPTGTVLQVVNASYSSSTSSATSTQIASGLTATITPKFSTSKILVMITAITRKQFSNTYVGSAIYRNGSNIKGVAFGGLYTANSETNSGMLCINYLDSPATTSATTYALYIASGANTSNVLINPDAPTDTSTITLMEIAG